MLQMPYPLYTIKLCTAIKASFITNKLTIKRLPVKFYEMHKRLHLSVLR